MKQENKTPNEILGKANPILESDGKDHVAAKANYTAMGKADGQTIQKAINSGFGTMRSILTERAESFSANDEIIAAWLSGYGDIMGKTKKSEASTVFKAYSINADGVHGFEGVYNDWITFCREIKNKTQPGVSGHSRNPSVTAKGLETVVEKVAVMNAGQVKGVLDKGYTQLKLVSGDNWEKAILVEIESQAEVLKTSKQPFFQQMAESIQKIVGEYLTKQDAKDATDQAKEHHVPTEGEVNPPTPLGIVDHQEPMQAAA